MSLSNCQTDVNNGTLKQFQAVQTGNSVTGHLACTLPLLKGHANSDIIPGYPVSCGFQCSALSLRQAPAQRSCCLLSLLGGLSTCTSVVTLHSVHSTSQHFYAQDTGCTANAKANADMESCMHCIVNRSASQVTEPQRQWACQDFDMMQASACPPPGNDCITPQQTCLSYHEVTLKHSSNKRFTHQNSAEGPNLVWGGSPCTDTN